MKVTTLLSIFVGSAVIVLIAILVMSIQNSNKKTIPQEIINTQQPFDGAIPQ
ncbi:hypothetical protein IPM65_06195 [Candidatus Roizmanbacteria bacterium]|nr:MAG: hypothetical protein IPM65_06195 [Candidatus Roizmanbacteria bacterium]